MKRFANILYVVLAVAFLMTLISPVLQAEETVKCMVSGKEIEKSEAKGSYEYKGKTYYFCCENCKDAFVKNPEKYIADPGSGHGEEGHMHGEHEGHMHGEEAESDTAVDPICNMKVKKADAKNTTEYKGKTYYFCSAGCKEKFLKDPEKYVPASEEMVKCPVMGHEVKKTDSTPSHEYNGKTYYFCCAGCKEKFIADPEKYINKK